MERDAVAALVDGLDDLARSRQARVEDERRDERGLLLGERPEPDLLRLSLAEQAGPPLARRSAGTDLVDPVRPDDEQRLLRASFAQLADDLEAELVRPLEVLEHQQRGSVDGGGDQVDDVEDQHPAGTEVVGTTVVTERQQVPAQGPERRVVTQAPGQVAHGRERYLPVLRRQGALRDLEPGLPRELADRPEQAGLADARIAREQHEAAMTLGGLGDPPLGEREQVVATDEKRAQDGARPTHRVAESTTAHRGDIGHPTDTVVPARTPPADRVQRRRSVISNR